MKISKLEVLVRLAKRLDPLISEIECLEARDCMREMSPLVKAVLSGGDQNELIPIAGHLIEHALEMIERAKANGSTWEDFWNAGAWNSFASLVSCLISDEESVEKECINHIAACIVTFEDGKKYPREFHWNQDIKYPTRAEDGFRDFRNNLTLTFQERVDKILIPLGQSPFSPTRTRSLRPLQLRPGRLQ